MNKTLRYGSVIGVLAVLVGLAIWYSAAPGPYDKLATCLKGQSVTFYGAFWCPHCQATKRGFGKSAEKLPYVECSNPAGNAQTQICIDQKIVSYPTWDFPKTITLPAATTDTKIACSAKNAPPECASFATGSWIATIGGRQFLTPSEPILTAGTWTLPAHSRTSGEVPIETIASLAQCPVK